MRITHPKGRTFIHLGSNHFDSNLFDPIRNQNDKPLGGLWANDVETDFGWKEYCLAEEMFPLESPRLTHHFYFQLKDDAKILHLEDPEDFDFLPIRWGAFKDDLRNDNYQYSERFLFFSKFRYVNWEAVKNIGIDAVEYIRTPYGHDVFYTWDFDSLVVFNPDAIIPVTNTKEETA